MPSGGLLNRCTILGLRRMPATACGAVLITALQLTLLASSVFLDVEDLHRERADQLGVHRHDLEPSGRDALTARLPHYCPGCVLQRDSALPAESAAVVLARETSAASCAASARCPRSSTLRAPSSRAPPRT